MYKEARKQVGLSQEEASFQLHIGLRSLCKYEAGEVVPGPDVALQMSRVYNKPNLTHNYCKHYCAIGQAYSYDILNNIDNSMPAIILKLVGEMKEACMVIDQLMEVSVNKGSKADFTDDQWDKFIAAIHELLDVEHNIEIFKIAIEGLTEETTLIAELTAQHNLKCRDHGYLKKESRPLRAAR